MFHVEQLRTHSATNNSAVGKLNSPDRLHLHLISTSNNPLYLIKTPHKPMQKERIPLATCADYQLEVENGFVTRIKVKPNVFCSSFQSIAVSKYLTIKADNFSPSDYTILVTNLYDCIVESTANERMVTKYSGSIQQQYKDKVESLEREILRLKLKIQSQSWEMARVIDRYGKEDTKRKKMLKDLFDKL